MKIKTFTVSLQHSKVEKETEVKLFKPPKPGKPRGRKYTSKIREIYAPYLEDMFYNNELAAYKKKARTNKQMQKAFLDKYRYEYGLKRRFCRYEVTMGMLRKRYNMQELYVTQQPVYLLSIPYNEFNIPVLGGRHPYTYLYFEEAYQWCLIYKIGDPRFIPPELLTKLRDKVNSNDPEWQGWSVPDTRWISKFETDIKKEAYNSVKFPCGWAREDTPFDFTPRFDTN